MPATHEQRNAMLMTKESMATIWEELLGHRSFDFEQSFFDVGGHSLLANSLFSEIEQKFGISLPIVTVFDAPTISELVDVVNNKLAAEVAT